MVEPASPAAGVDIRRDDALTGSPGFVEVTMPGGHETLLATR